MLVTPELLAKLAPLTPDEKRDRFIPFLNYEMPRYGITTPLRVAAFLATICLESDYFRTTKEYRAKAGTKARQNQDRYWLTNDYGRGLIQLTWRENREKWQAWYDKAYAGNLDFVNHPELLEQPNWAVESACWFWWSNDCNVWADKGDFRATQGIVNAGSPSAKKINHLADRTALYDVALKHLTSEAGAVHPPSPVEIPPSTILHDPPPSITPETLPDTVEVPKYSEINAPKETGGTDLVKSWSWKLPSLSVIVTFLVSTVESLVSKGYFDAKDVGEKLYVFFVVNWRYAVYLGIAAIGYLVVKKILSVIPPLIEAVTEAHPDFQPIRFTRRRDDS